MMVTAFRAKVAVITVLALGVLAAGRVAAAQERGRSLDDVLAVGDPSGVSVVLASDGPLAGQLFTLDNPPRIVLDLPGVVSRVVKRIQPVEQSGVARVRVAQFQTAPQPVTRVVVDLDHALPYHLETTAKGAVLRVGGAPTESAAESGGPPAGPESSQAAASVAVAPASAASPGPASATAGAGSEATAQAATPPESGPASAAETGVSAAPTAGGSAEAPRPQAEPAAPAASDNPSQEQGASSSAAASATEQAPPASPVKVVDDPWKAAAAAEAESTARATPVAAPAAESLTAPPAQAPPQEKAPADSPWTTTPSAMVEEAPPAPEAPRGEHEIESQAKHFTGEPISLELKDADIKDVLRTFAKITELNIAVDPEVRGSVTVDLKNVPWDQALDLILRQNGLDYEVENNILRVAPLAKLTAEKAARARYVEQADAAQPLRTVTKALSYAKAEDVKKILTSQSFILSPRGTVVVDQRTNQLIIRDATDRIEGILSLIDQLDTPNPQVIIEARIVETTRTFSRALGLTWGFTSLGDAAHGTTTGWRFPNSYSIDGTVNLAQPGNGVIGMTFADILDSFNLDFQLAAAESNGLVKIVSSPKITVQNNTKGNIQSGIMIPIQTVANNTVTVQYVNATLSLNVTPQITAEGTVLLEINVQKREPLAGINLQGGSNAPISTRDAQTTVMVRDGGTTVIGGIYQLNDQTNTNGIPGLSRLPILGALFRNHTVSNKHDELLIFITPRIVKY
jgi:type IV pilus assembly protein PilQ